MELVEEVKRWLTQALRDLKAARDSLRNSNYEWACFQAQQAAEKAVKALLYGHGVSAWGHSIVELLDYLKSFEEISEDLYVDAANLIDITYLQDTRTLLNPAIPVCTTTSRRPRER